MKANIYIALAAIIAALTATSPIASAADDETGTITLVATINGQAALRPVYWYVDGVFVTTNHSYNYKASAATHIVRARIGSTSRSRNVSVFVGQSTLALFNLTEAAAIVDAKK